MKHARLPLFLLAGGLLATGCSGSDEPRFGPLTSASATVSAVPSIQIGTIPLVHTTEQQAAAQAQAAAAESRSPAGRKRARDRVRRLRTQRDAVAGQFCSPYGSRGVTAAGQVLLCTYTTADPILRWRAQGAAGTATATPTPAAGATTGPATPGPTPTTAPPTAGPTTTGPTAGTPTPTEPTPSETTPTEPTPSETTPSEPTPSETTPTASTTADSPSPVPS